MDRTWPPCCLLLPEGRGAHTGPHPAHRGHAAPHSVHHRAQPPAQEEGIMVQRGGPRLALQPQSRWSWLQPLPPSVPTICCIKSFGPSSCLPFLCPSPQIFQVGAPRKPRANTRAGPRTQERRAASGTQQGAASGGRCRAYCAEGTGHARCVCPHLHTRVHTHAALTHKHVCTYRWGYTLHTQAHPHACRHKCWAYACGQACGGVHPHTRTHVDSHSET